MVFLDLSTFSHDSNDESNSQVLKIASVTDRFLAFCFDIALFSPLFSLLLSQIFKKIELKYYTDPSGLEFSILTGIGLVCVGSLTAFCQAYCLWRWGTTPGKYFFKLKVVTVLGTKLTFMEALLRSFLWVGEFFLLGLAFLEILSQRQRRPLHDRAADTMVVTIKMIGDKGPHPLEAHFVRNMIFMFSTVLVLWGTVFLTQIYHMASRGDFKKTELEGSDYLCPRISEQVARGQSRLDLSIAEFVAEEIDEECLLTESDFALWTGEKSQQSWAYLGKSIVYQFDQDKSNEYLQKVCQTDQSAESCRIAAAIKGQQRDQLASMDSLTAKVLMIREHSGRGEFTQALKGIGELSSESEGFEKYSQKQTVKLLWTLNRKAESVGAYLNTWQFMGRQDQADLAAWLCLEEVGDRCENRNYLACNNLRENLLESAFENVTSEAVIGLVSEAECKKSHDFSLNAFHKVIEDNVALRDLVLAIDSDSGWSHEHRIETLRQLSFNQQKGISRVVQRRAQMALLDNSHNSEDAVVILSMLRANDKHDWAWQSIMKRLNVLAEEKGQSKLAQALHKDWPQIKPEIPRLPASESE